MEFHFHFKVVVINSVFFHSVSPQTARMEPVKNARMQMVKTRLNAQLDTASGLALRSSLSIQYQIVKLATAQASRINDQRLRNQIPTAETIPITAQIIP